MSIHMPARHWTNIIIAGLMLLVDGVFASDTRLRVDDLTLVAINSVEISPQAESDPVGLDLLTLDASETVAHERSGYTSRLLVQANNVPLGNQHFQPSQPRAPPVSVR